MSIETERSSQRVTSVLALLMTGLIFIIVATLLHSWMTWATGALIIRFAMWLGED